MEIERVRVAAGMPVSVSTLAIADDVRLETGSLSSGTRPRSRARGDRHRDRDRRLRDEPADQGGRGGREGEHFAVPPEGPTEFGWDEKLEAIRRATPTQAQAG